MYGALMYGALMYGALMYGALMYGALVYSIHCTSLRSVKALGEVDSDEDDSALSWVDKMRQKEEEKRLAQERVSVKRVWLLGVQGCCLGCRGAGVLFGVQGCCLGCRGAVWGAGVLLEVGPHCSLCVSTCFSSWWLLASGSCLHSVSPLYVCASAGQVVGGDG